MTDHLGRSGVSPEITDEMVERAARIEWEHSAQHRWAALHESHREHFRAAMRAALEAVLLAAPLSGVSMRSQWKPDERVACVSRPDGPYGAEHLRPGVVVAVDEVLRRHERLKVRFDDGEERYINPDVMRHV